MLAKLLTGPHYYRGPEIKNPSWAQIERAIHELDNADLSLVIIGIAPDHKPPWMGVAGGDGKYVDLETALKVAKTFAEAGQLDDSFVWITP